LSSNIPDSGVVLTPGEYSDESIAIAELDITLDGLEAQGILQDNNHMDIEALLNPISERVTYNEISDEDIYTAVLADWNSQSTNNISIAEDIIDPLPTRNEAVQAAFTLERYLSTQDSDFSGILDTALIKFRGQLRHEEFVSAKPTKITDVFHLE